MDTVVLARDISLTVLAFLAILFMVTGLVVMIRLYRQVTHLLISARRIGEQGEMAAEIITGGIIQPIARGVALAALVGTGIASITHLFRDKKKSKETDSITLGRDRP